MPGAPYVHMLRAMTTVLIVVGVILFLLLDAYVIARVFRSRASADDYASIAVPADHRDGARREAEADLSGVLQRAQYRGRRHRVRHVRAPGDVTSATGEALEVKGPGFRGMGSSLSTPGAARAAR